MSSIGQIPNLQDRQHRQFLARLKESVEAIAARPAAADPSAAIAALRAELVAMITTTKVTQSHVEQPVGDSQLQVLLGGDVDIWTVVAQTATGAITASNDTAEHANCVVGIALAAGQTDDYIPIATGGSIVNNDGWNWTVGAVLWLGAAGALIDPTAGDYVPPSVAPLFNQAIAIAVSPTSAFVLLGLPVLTGDGGPILSLNDAGFAQRTNIRVRTLLAADVPAFSVVARTSTGAVAADNATAAHANLVFGITTAAGVTGDDVLTAQSGSLVTNDAWSWTAGALLWLGADGQMTETLPTTALVQPVAIAMTSDTVFVLIGLPVLSASGGDMLGVDTSGRVQRVGLNATSVASLPSAGNVGQVVAYDHSLWFDNGAIWVRTGPQVGAIEMLGHTSVDAGWKLCNGAAVSRTTYAVLFAKIGTTYGVGDGSTTFNLPNMSDKFVAGNTPGATGGANEDDLSHTHSASSLATAAAGAHDHGSGTGFTIAHNHGGFTGTEGQPQVGIASGSDHYVAPTGHTHSIPYAGSHNHSIPVQAAHTHAVSGTIDTGLTDPHDNRPAFTGVAFYIFAGV